MDLQPYIETIQQQLLQAAEAGGDEARILTERLVAPLGAALRLALQDALGTAVEEITCDLAPGSVELRLRGRDPEFVVTRPPAELPAAEPGEGGGGAGRGGWPSPWTADELVPPAEADEGGMARINLRLPDHLKTRVESAARREGLSVNTWLVRAAAAALRRTEPARHESRPATGGQRYTGWAR
jgi:hypothetical protein